MSKQQKTKKNRQPSFLKFIFTKYFLVAFIFLAIGMGFGFVLEFVNLGSAKEGVASFVITPIYLGAILSFFIFAILMIFSIVIAFNRRGKKMTEISNLEISKK